MTRIVARARETSKVGAVPSVEALWRIRGIDGEGRTVIGTVELKTCGPDGERELQWYRDLKIDRVASIEIEAEVDEYSGLQALGWAAASPQSVLVAESEDTKYRALHRPELSAQHRRIARFAVPRKQLGGHLLLSAHVVRGVSAGSARGSAPIGQYLARTPHTERLRIRFEAPDWKEGGGLPILWTSFEGEQSELIWRWKGLEHLSDADPDIRLELNSARDAVQSLLQSRDTPRKWARTAIAHLIAAEAIFELGVVAASQCVDGRVPSDTGVAAALKMLGERLGESPSDLVAELSDPKSALEVMHRLRVKFGMGYNMNELVEIATRRGGAQ
jgi:hypothetical protein